MRARARADDSQVRQPALPLAMQHEHGEIEASNARELLQYADSRCAAAALDGGSPPATGTHVHRPDELEARGKSA
jgi:hypothetical protein